MRKTNRKYPIAAMQKKVNMLSAGFKKAMQLGDYPAAKNYCENVLAIMPDNNHVLADYGLACMRNGDYQQSYDIYVNLYQKSDVSAHPGNWLDGLAEVCGWLGKEEELAFFGNLSLTLADAGYRDGAVYPAIQMSPPKFVATQQDKNVIAFSLYGANPKYTETLVKNVEVAKDLYRDWTCRVYFNNSVPDHVIDRLRTQNVQLIDMSKDEGIPPTMWRFLVMDDSSITRFIVRDADSLISEKEAAAVAEWLDSDYWFHHMRDYFTHTDLMLAGLWGGCNGVFKDVRTLMHQFITGYKGAERFTDQQFLKKVLWPTVRNSILNHDEIFNFHHAQKYPAHAPVRWKTTAFHIGSNAGYLTISGAVRSLTNGKQAIDLTFNNTSVTYYADANEQSWSLNMPFFLIELFRKDELTVSIKDASDK